MSVVLNFQHCNLHSPLCSPEASPLYVLCRVMGFGANFGEFLRTGQISKQTPQVVELRIVSQLERFCQPCFGRRREAPIHYFIHSSTLQLKIILSFSFIRLILRSLCISVMYSHLTPFCVN